METRSTPPMDRDSFDALDAIDAFCNQCAAEPSKTDRLSAEELRIMDVASIKIGQFTAKEIARIRGVNWRRVYEWIDEVEGRLAAMARESRERRRSGVAAH
jgi:transcription antitermination factor NusA-like protein